MESRLDRGGTERGKTNRLTGKKKVVEIKDWQFQ